MWFRLMIFEFFYLLFIGELFLLKMMYYSVAVVWGLAQGAFIANLLAVVYNFCGEEHLAVLFGLELFAEGIGAIIGAPLSGKCVIYGPNAR